MKDKIIYYGLCKAEDYYECSKHKVPYPRGAVCPKCKKEENSMKVTDN